VPRGHSGGKYDFIVVILAGFGTKETEDVYKVYPCIKIEKIAKMHCYNQTIMNKGSVLILAGILYNPESNANLMRNWITDIDPKYWNCTNNGSFLESVVDYGPTSENGKTIMRWNNLEVLNQTHVLLKGRRINETAERNITLKNFDSMWWNYVYGKTISTMNWNCETGKAEIKRLRVLISKSQSKLEITDDSKEVTPPKTGSMTYAAQRAGPKPIDRWLRMSEFQDKILIHSIHRKKPVIPAEDANWINCYYKSRGTPMCENIQSCPWIGKMIWPSNKGRSTIDHRKQCAHKIDRGEKVWYCVIRAEAPWDQTLMEKYENETLNIWHQWIMRHYNFTMGSGSEGDRTTWTVKATLEGKKRANGNYKHPYTLEYFPNPGIPLDRILSLTNFPPHYMFFHGLQSDSMFQLYSSYFMR